MWDAPVPIFDDEDESKLIDKFVELSARYPNRLATELTAYIFKNLRDPFPRSNQAAFIWSQDIDILERIAAAKLNGGREPEPVDSKEVMLKKLEAIYNDMDIKTIDRIKAMELHAKITGEIEGEADDLGGGGRRPIVVNYMLDPRSQANAA